MGRTVLKLETKESGIWANEKHMCYYKYAGEWSVDFRLINGKIFSVCTVHKKLHNRELIPTTRREWVIDNKGYIE